MKSFRDKETEKLFHREPSPKLPHVIQRTALRKLLVLDAAVDTIDLKVPLGNCLEALKGQRKGQYSIRINDQWRICFHPRDGDVFEVEIIDYHEPTCIWRKKCR